MILVPVLRRPHRVAPLLESVTLNTTGPYRVLFLADDNDQAEVDAIEPYVGTLVQLLRIHDGNYAHKINVGVRATSEPLLLFGADDLEFHPGWLEAAKAKLRDGVGVVGTNDLCNPRSAAGTLATHPLVTREYTKLGTIDNPGQVLHEGYPHEFCDDEFTETAKHRKAFDHAPDSIVEHLHPMVGKAPTDDIYDQMRFRMRIGRRIYRRRRPLWT